MVMGMKRGLDCKLFYGTAGSQAATELTNCQDLNIELDHEEFDATSRASGGWEEVELGMKRGTLNWTMIQDSADAAYLAVEDAFMNKTALALFITRGDGKGLDADFKITKFSEKQPLRGAVVIDVSARPSRSTRTPQFIQ